MPASIQGSFYDLFLGSGLISYNIDVSQKHLAVDIDPNVILMHKAIKRFSWNRVDKLQTFIQSKWDLKEKDDYYAFRDWFNDTLWNTQHKERGLGLLFLSRSCMNGLIRFGPNGFNQSYGKRINYFTQDSYSIINYRASSIDFICDDFRNISVTQSSFVYADPPYLNNPIDTYGRYFDRRDLKQVLRICRNANVFWYTDTSNSINKRFAEKYKEQVWVKTLKEMRRQSPGSRTAQVLTNRNEILVTNWFHRIWRAV